MPKALRMMLSATTTTAPPPAAPPRKKRQLAPTVILALIVIVAVGTGVAVAETSGGPAHYACIDIAHQGSSEVVTTTGLIHWVNSAYYISCNEGSSLPSSTFRASCLTISPKTIPAPIGVGAATEYYYLSSTGSPISIQGAATPTNATEYVSSAGLSLTATC